MPFGHASYRRLGPALALNTFAGGMWAVALAWEVIGFGGGAGQLSVVMTAAAAGVLLPCLLAGAVADRVPQKRIMTGVVAVEVVGMTVIAALSWADRTSVWPLATVALMTGLARAFFYPAYSAWLPALIPEEDLQAVNGFEGMVRPTVGQALGPAAAGALVGSASPSAALTLAALANLVGLVLLLLVPLTAVRRDVEPAPAGRSGAQQASTDALATALGDIREGLAYLVHTRWVLATLVFAAVMMLSVMGPLQVLTPFLIKDHLGGAAGEHGTVLAAFGAGGAVGALAMGQLRMPRRYLSSLLLLWVVGCLAFLGFAVAEHVWVLVGSGFVLGVGFAAAGVIWGTLLQRRVPPDLLGRVASLDFFVSISLMPVSLAIAAPLSALIGLRATYVAAAVVPVLAAGVVLAWARLPQEERAYPLDRTSL